ncbi:MAG: divergent polysaccharide deacetylase family protein [Treponema sp.]|nr:divergent polysaccharide deacetylase family protein [Treponema sp.]
MPTSKKRTTKTTSKKTTRTSSRTTRKRKAKKPKVTLSAGKVYVLSGIIIAVCAAALFFSVFTARIDSGNSQPQTSERAIASEEKTPPKKEQATKAEQRVAPAQQPVTAKKESKQKKSASSKTTVSSTKNSSATQMQPAEQPKSQKNAQPVSSKSASSQPQKTTASPATVSQPDASKTLASAKPDKTQPTVQSAKPEKPEPKSPFAIPPAKNGATLVFVIDDAGLHPENVKRYTALPFPIAIAVLPRLSHSKECAAVVRAGYKELMLHQPMQAHAYPNGKIPNPGEGAILPDMSTAQVAETIKQNLEEIGPGVKGFNNHEGSLITENAIKMGAALEVAAERGIYFLDSRTTSHSAVPQAALERDMRYIARFAPFLDNKIDREAMLSELYKGLEVANKNGYAVIIGHVDKSVNILPQLLTDIYPYLVQQGYKFAVPSQLR